MRLEILNQTNLRGSKLVVSCTFFGVGVILCFLQFSSSEAELRHKTTMSLGKKEDIIYLCHIFVLSWSVFKDAVHYHIEQIRGRHDPNG